jgi:hypothetical protein
VTDYCASMPPAPSGDVCGCGWPLHYDDPYTEAGARSVIEDYGWWHRITVKDIGDFWVPRHWEFAHPGRPAADLPWLSERYGWPQVTPGTPLSPGAVSPELKR